MKFILNTLRVWYHELRTVIVDDGVLTFLLLVPLAYPLLYAYIYTNERVFEIPIAVVDESQSSQSRDFVRRVDATPDACVSVRCDNMEDAKNAMQRGDVYGVLYIPSSFSKDIWKGEQTRVGLYCDMQSMLYYKTLLMAVSNVSLEVNKDIKVEKYLHTTTNREEEIARMPIKYDYIPLFNPQSGFAAFLIPPVLMLILQQALLLGIGMAMGTSRERYNGRIVPPVSIYSNVLSMLLGKMLFYLPLFILLGVYAFICVTDWFSLPRLGDYFTFVTFLFPYLTACISLAFLLSVFVYRREDCVLLFMFLSVPLLFMSGISWPTVSMPAFWKYFAWLFPSTFGLNGYVRISTMGASLSDVHFEYYALWIQTAIYFTAAYFLYCHKKKHYRRKRN